MPQSLYLHRLTLCEDRVPNYDQFPYCLPFVRELNLVFQTPITFFVGENGSGKSTLIEAIAELCRLPIAGGGRNELTADYGFQARSDLASVLRAGFRKQPQDGYFFRSELQAYFASLLEFRQADPDFSENPFARYGGRSLHHRSHGEAFLAMFLNWTKSGIILMDEPESALSAQRQLSLLVHLAKLAKRGDVQFLIATHSPILLTLPDATILSFDDTHLSPIQLRDTAHYQITRGILEAPERYWHNLLRDEESI